jgi:hypothetical protein
MERSKGGVTDDLLEAASPDAANEPVIEGSGPPAAWDPFEVWRTRVRDVQQKRPAGKPRNQKKD